MVQPAGLTSSTSKPVENVEELENPTEKIRKRDAEKFNFVLVADGKSPENLSTELTDQPS